MRATREKRGKMKPIELAQKTGAGPVSCFHQRVGGGEKTQRKPVNGEKDHLMGKGRKLRL